MNDANRAKLTRKRKKSGRATTSRADERVDSNSDDAQSRKSGAIETSGSRGAGHRRRARREFRYVRTPKGPGWGVDDFDEAAALPHTNDRVRLAVSGLLARRSPQPARLNGANRAKRSSDATHRVCEPGRRLRDVEA